MADAYLSQMLGSSRAQPPIVEAGTARTLAASDNGRTIFCTSASAVTITMPPDVLWVGFKCKVAQVGDGAVSFAEGAGVTIISLGDSLTLGRKGARAELEVYAANTALLG